MSSSNAEETRNLLIDAYLELLKERGPEAISVREVAAAAGVNHGLVHRHFGSKEALVRAAVARLGAEFHDGTRAGLSARTFARLRENPTLARVAARVCLDGPHDVLAGAAPDPARLAEIVAPIEALLARLGVAGAIDGRVANALGAAAFLGWFVLRPLLEVYGLPDDADDQVARLAAWIDALLSSQPQP